MKGQIALIVMLVSAVMMTIGLSISKRAVVETKVSSDEESLKQAFNAAESGIENYLMTKETSYTSEDLKSTADIVATPIGSADQINFSEYTTENSPVYYWLRDHEPDGMIDFSAGFNGTDLMVCVENTFFGSIKVDYFYQSGVNYRVWRNGYNFGTSPANQIVDGYVDSSSAAPESCSDRAGAKMVNIAAPIAGMTPLLITVKPIFGGTRVSIRTDFGTFPEQGENISSVGRVGDVGANGQTVSGASQTITVHTGYSVPGFMLEALNAEGSVLSN